jgi:hypothetical protein
LSEDIARERQEQDDIQKDNDESDEYWDIINSR